MGNGDQKNLIDDSGSQDFLGVSDDNSIPTKNSCFDPAQINKDNLDENLNQLKNQASDCYNILPIDNYLGNTNQVKYSNNIKTMQNIYNLQGSDFSSSLSNSISFTNSSTPEGGNTRPASCSKVTTHARLQKKSRSRVLLNYAQTMELEKAFTTCHYPDMTLRKTLSEKLQLPTSKIQIWFSNRRAKFRRGEKESLTKDSMVTNTPTQINSLGPDLYDQNDPKGKERTLQFQIGRGELENPNIFMRALNEKNLPQYNLMNSNNQLKRDDQNILSNPLYIYPQTQTTTQFSFPYNQPRGGIFNENTVQNFGTICSSKCKSDFGLKEKVSANLGLTKTDIINFLNSSDLLQHTGDSSISDINFDDPELGSFLFSTEGMEVKEKYDSGFDYGLSQTNVGSTYNKDVSPGTTTNTSTFSSIQNILAGCGGDGSMVKMDDSDFTIPISNNSLTKSSFHLSPDINQNINDTSPKDLDSQKDKTNCY